MYLRRTEDQQALAEACRTLARGRWPLSAVGSSLEAASIPAEMWSALTEMGWCHVLVPGAVGGLGLGPVEAGVVAEESGRALVPGPLVEGLVAGLFPACDPAASTIAPFGLSTIEVGDGRLNGRASLVPYADHCSSVFVAAGAALWIVETASPRVRIAAHSSLDPVSRPCTVELDEVEALRVGDASDLARVEVLMYCLLAARLLGVIDAVIELSADYARAREQFGRPIGSFQAVQQLLADQVKRAVATRSICFAAQAAIADGAHEAQRWASVAKAYGSVSARRAAEAAVQVHGGIGFTTEVPVHLYLKHSLTLQAAWGDERELEQRAGERVLAVADANASTVSEPDGG